jgi:hypothetical protein
MNFRGKATGRSSALKASIRAVEQRMEVRRSIVSSTAKRITHTVREQITAPATLITAGLFGVALHRGPRLQGSHILAILHAANTGLRFLLAETTRPRDAPD